VCNDSAAAHKRAAGAPENEIEVTPPMIEAGVGELCCSNEDFESKEEIVSRIYLAMISAPSGQ
jgi:hypothetical protein